MKISIRRTFLFPAVVLFALATLTLYCMKKEITPQQALSLLPKESMALASVNVKAMVDGGLYDDIASDEKTRKELDDFRQKTGIDIRTDLTRVVVSVAPDVEMTKDFSGAVFGNFDKDKILKALREKAQVEENNHEGVFIYRVISPKGEPTFVSFLSHHVLAIGGPAGIKQVVDRYKGKAESIESNQTMMDLVKEAKQNDMVWAVALVPEKFRESANAAPMGKGFEGLQALLLSINAGKNLDLSLVGKCNTEPEAKRLSETLTGLMGLTRLAAAAKPEVAEVLDSLHVEVQGNNVDLNLSLTEEQLKKLSAMAAAAQAKTPAPAGPFSRPPMQLPTQPPAQPTAQPQ
jgi:hypothetical protein